jgi:hypothetical protein
LPGSGDVDIEFAERDLALDDIEVGAVFGGKAVAVDFLEALVEAGSKLRCSLMPRGLRLSSCESRFAPRC